jgi:3-oxoacyl-(acyl-carrier-protein) synthase
MSNDLLKEPEALKAIARAHRMGVWTGVHVVSLTGHAYEAMGFQGDMVRCRTLDHNVYVLHPAKDLVVLERTYEYD